MFDQLTAIFALAISVAGLAGVWWTTSDVRDISRKLAWHQKQIDVVMSHAPESLKAEVDALTGAVSAMRASNRREFGAIWARLGGRKHDSDAIETHQPNGTDFEALLDLQSRPMPAPK